MSIYVHFQLRRRRWFHNNGTHIHTHYPPPGGESEDEDFTGGHHTYCKNSGSTVLVDQMELVNLNTDPSYGAMWKSRPPGYIDSGRPGYTDSGGHQGGTQHQSDVTDTPPSHPRAVLLQQTNQHVLITPHDTPTRGANTIVQDTPTRTATLLQQELIPGVTQIPCEPCAKLAAMSTFRPDGHVYETTKINHRSDIPDIQEMAMHAREIS